jgi:hypothetical protein
MEWLGHEMRYATKENYSSNRVSMATEKHGTAYNKICLRMLDIEISTFSRCVTANLTWKCSHGMFHLRH